MNETGSTEMPAPEGSLRALRVAAAIGVLVAIAAIVVGFRFGMVYGIGAVVALPVLPLAFVLAVEAVRRTS